MRFKQKVVIVTGAAGGIGTEITRRFLDEGANVCAVDLSQQGLDKLAGYLGNPSKLSTVPTDITSEESCANLYKKVLETFGAVDIVINNAGWFLEIAFENLTYADWRRVIAVNLDGTFLIIKSMLPLLKKSSDGRIINISSGTVFSPPPAGKVPYIAAKAGILGLTRSLAVELGGFNIKVNAITPGLVSTAAVLDTTPEEFINLLAQRGALKRQQVAGDLVGAIAFLASEDASFITGQTINVDGGKNFV